MWYNQLKFTLRIFLKDGLYSYLNVFGLAIGIASGIIVFLYLQNDLNYDKHHSNYADIYRISTSIASTGVSINSCFAPRPLAEILKNEVPGVINYCRFDTYSHVLVQTEKETKESGIFEDDVVKVDTSLFSIFTHEFIKGNPKTSLVGPNKVVITESIEKKYFKEEDALGKTLVLFGNDQYVVTGIIKDLPDNVHLKYNIILSGFDEGHLRYQEDGQIDSEVFWNSDIYAYLQFVPGYEANQFNEDFVPIYNKYYKAFGDRINGKATPNLERLDKIHFYSTLDFDEARGNIQYVIVFAIIGALILVLACINYMNLSTARAIQRTTEIGIRKVLGYEKSKLFFTILFEALVMSIIAMMVAIVLVFVLLHVTPLNEVLGKSLSLDLINNPYLAISIGLITIAVAFLSGVYPAVFIPSMPVISAMKGQYKVKGSNVFIRKFLIILQFVVSILVVISTYIMGNQIDFVRNKSLGFSKDNVLLLDIPSDEVAGKIEVFKTELLQNTKINSISSSYSVPGKEFDEMVMKVKEEDGNYVQRDFNVMFSSKDHIETLDLTIVSGRNFNPEMETDYRMKFVINEKLASTFGWTSEEAVGKAIRYFHGQEDGEVIGVVKDFNFSSLHSTIEPLIIIQDKTYGGYLHIKMESQDLPTTLATIENAWGKIAGKHPFQYDFLDSTFDKQYKADEKQHNLINGLSVLCIFISILGLIGLTAFSAAQKTKEIGVRKSLGASVPQILILFSKDFSKLLLVSFVIAVPVANYFTTEWMQSFAYQTTVGWFDFVGPGVAVIFLAILVVNLQSYHAATINPVRALKDE